MQHQSRRTSVAGRLAAAIRSVVEQLEERKLLSVTLTDGVLNIEGRGPMDPRHRGPFLRSRLLPSPRGTQCSET